MSRADFEKWAQPHGLNIKYFRPDPSEYDMAGTQMAYDAWQAAESHTARECVKVGETVRLPGQMLAHEFGITNCLDAIRATYPDAFKEGE